MANVSYFFQNPDTGTALVLVQGKRGPEVRLESDDAQQQDESSVAAMNRSLSGEAFDDLHDAAVYLKKVFGAEDILG